MPRPPPPGARLDQQRKADALGLRAQRFGALVVAVVSGHRRHVELAYAAFRFDLAAHRRHRIGRRADEDHSRRGDRARERRTFREKAVTRMHRVGAHRDAGGDDRVDVEIRLRRRAPARRSARRRRSADGTRSRRLRSRCRAARYRLRARRARRAPRSLRDWRRAGGGSCVEAGLAPFEKRPQAFLSFRADAQIGDRARRNRTRLFVGWVEHAADQQFRRTGGVAGRRCGSRRSCDRPRRRGLRRARFRAPSRCAQRRTASNRSPVRKSARACDAPIFESTNGEITAGMMPSFTSVKPNIASSAAIAMSQRRPVRRPRRAQRPGCAR